MEKIKVLIADDHPLMRQGVRALLQADMGIEIVGEAGNGLEVVDKAAECQPDVVLMDIVMPILDGLEATRRIKRQRPDTNVIILTSYSDKAFIIDAALAGASAYLLKDASSELLCNTIRTVINGGIVLKDSLLRQTLTMVATLIDSTPALQQEMSRVLGGVEEFTSRERRILELLADGWTNKEIGRQLNIGEETVKKHVQSISAKLNASDRTQAAVKAVRIGLIKEPTAQYVKNRLNGDAYSDLTDSLP